MVLKVNVACGFHLEALEGVLCLGDGNIVLRHNFSPLLDIAYRGSRHPRYAEHEEQQYCLQRLFRYGSIVRGQERIIDSKIC